MNNQSIAACACAVLFLSLSKICAGAESPPAALPVAGWLERARISPGGVVLEAKLDTGARTSSLHAVNRQQFERDGEPWVAFDVIGVEGRSVRIERPIVRMARIKSALGVDQGRPTVTLGICIGLVYRVTEVNLVDRSDLAKPLLIGRRFLKGRMLIDLNRRYQFEPRCTRKAVP